jgi:type I restriction enzyme M protein
LEVWELTLKDKQNAHNALHSHWLMTHTMQQKLQPDVKHSAQLYKQWLAAWEAHEKEHDIQRHKEVLDLRIKAGLRQCIDELEQHLNAWKQSKYLTDESGWLLKKFVDGVYADVPGLCKQVSIDEVAEKDWSLSPGRYVGIDTSADVVEDWEEKLQFIHTELDILNAEAIELAETISSNYKSILG